VCLAVAALHQQQPPIIHRDIKLENVLLSKDKGSFKLCDFGSATTTVIEPGTTAPVVACEEEIQKYTTLQYRAPEMVDLYSKKKITTKSDVWVGGRRGEPLWRCELPMGHSQTAGTRLTRLALFVCPFQALGCLLFKLSFFEDAFGETPLAVMSVKYSIPSEHKFSDNLVQLIRACGRRARRREATAAQTPP
jgi:AP2-associated kinase